jgi:uncharacterized RDD family membrane protein YckC
MQKPTQVVGRRVAAFVIDFVVWLAIIAAAWYALTENVRHACGSGGGIEINGDCHGFTQHSHRTIWFVIIGVVSIGLFIVMQGLTGKTPGKAMLGIKVVKSDGNAPGILRTIGRELMWIVDFWIVALIAALASQNNQRLGDMVAGTYVVDRNLTGAIGTTAAQPSFAPPPPSGSPVTRLRRPSTLLRRHRTLSPPTGTRTRTARRGCATGTASDGPSTPPRNRLVVRHDAALGLER